MDATRRAMVVKALAEGASIRATVRMTGAAKATVTKLLVEIGAACAAYQDKTLRRLETKVVQSDEIWAFVGAKEKNVPKELRGQGRGDVWTWTAMDADSKLIFSWYVGDRSLDAAKTFMDDVAFRLSERVQLTTDGLSHYRTAVEEAFGWNGVDYAMLVKTYAFVGAKGSVSTRYSPGVCTGAEKHAVMGNPDERLVSTSFVERSNLTMRMQMRRFTRLTNAFSKKIENHAAAVALHFMYYNFVKPHGTLTKAAKGIHTTPAMASGVADHVWTVEEVVALVASKELSAKEVAAKAK
jgi:IS1 family transposase